MAKAFFSKWKVPLLLGSASLPTIYFLKPYISNFQNINKLEAELQQKIEKFGESDQSIAELYAKLGELYQDSKQIEKAIEKYKKASELMKIHRHEEALSFLDFNTRFSQCLKEIGELKEAAQYLEKSIDKKIANSQQSRILLINEYKDVGLAYEKVNEIESAIRCYNKGLNIETELTEPENKITPSILERLGDIYYNRGEPEFYKPDLLMASECYQKALRKVNVTDGLDSIKAAGLLYDIAKANYALKKLDQSTYYCERSLEAYKQNNDTANLRFAHCSSLAGSDYVLQRKDDKALALLEQSISVFEKLEKGDKDEEKFGRALINLGVMLMKLKRPLEAAENTKKGVEKFEKTKGKESLETLEATLNLAVILVENGERLEAVKRAKDVYDTAREKFGDASPLTQSALQLITQLAS